jgi:hypothetical protein
MLIWTLSGSGAPSQVQIVYGEKISETDINSGMEGNVFYYTLALSVADDFNYQHPESSFEIFQYIDSNEL